MIKKILYMLTPARAATISVASAETIPSNPVLLTAGEMDQVTAGLSASVDAVAGISSDFLSPSSTNTASMATFSALSRTCCPLMLLPP